MRVALGALGTYSWNEKEARQGEEGKEIVPATPFSEPLKPKGLIISGFGRRGIKTEKDKQEG